MNEIFSKQSYLQSLFGRVTAYPAGEVSVGEVYDDLMTMKLCLNEELTELMEALGNGSRDIHKPWKKECRRLRVEKYSSSQQIREEAVDALCFAINICMSVGVTEYTISEEYEKVFKKNCSRAVRQGNADTRDPET